MVKWWSDDLDEVRVAGQVIKAKLRKRITVRVRAG